MLENNESQPDIGELLAATKEELKGKLKPAEVRVDKETLIGATRAQNEALLFIHEQLKRLEGKVDGIEDTLTKRIDGVELKLGQWSARVENLEKQTESIEESITKQELINLEVDQFKCETMDSLSKTRECLESLDVALQELPNTITISATQVYHAREEVSETDARTLTVEDSIKHHTERMDEMENHTNSEINRVVEWVTNQKKDDEAKLNSLQEAMEQVEMELKETISYAEVEDKIAIKVRELVDQIKEALLAVEEDEADFKNVASALHGLFNSLKESKADKSEMAQLRNQIINSQLNHGPAGSSGPAESKGGVLDYKGLRKILSSYCKADTLDKKLDEKAGREFTTKRLDHTENMIDKILETIDELWFVLRHNESLCPRDGGNTREGDGSEESLKDNVAAPSENTRKASLRSLVPKGEDDQSKARTNRKSFCLGERNQPPLEKIVSQPTRPKTMVAVQRNGSSVKLNQRPCTSPGNLPYYITPKGERRGSTHNKHHFRAKDKDTTNLSGLDTTDNYDASLCVYNSQGQTEKGMPEESLEMLDPAHRKTQVFEGRATAL